MNRLLSLLFPPKCPYCGRSVGSGMTECDACRKSFPEKPFVRRAGAEVKCAAPFLYRNEVRNAIIQMKFHKTVFNADSLSAAVAGAVREVYGDNIPETVTCVPMSKDRLRKRGFNQAELLAEKTAALLGKSFVRTMKRDSGAEIQHELTREERINLPDRTYHIIDPSIVRDKEILLIDDIMTTGTTLLRCCQVLKDSGAKGVICAVAAITE